MVDFEKMYFNMTREVANAIDALDEISAKLKEAQLQCEEMFVGDDRQVKSDDIVNELENNSSIFKWQA